MKDMSAYFKNEEYLKKFELFREILTEYNKKCNLTSILEKKDMYIKHFLDSVIPEELFPLNSKVIEIGSGGGFPSIPLKIVRDDLSFTLVESTGKKCKYLEETVKKLALVGVKVLNIRAEEGGRKQELREKFDIAEARAVAALNTLSEYCLPFVKVGGLFIAYKGDVEKELEESKNAIEILGGAIEKVYSYSLPEDSGKRNVVVIKKIKKTPEKYPRGRGLERKKPL
ncbi:MAG: 16S rRNA (guanine(527)-N(7))-methyltransferase RsmG [Clostridiales bacterium]|nr:16S rRNA (guanine(527)-N(7))-methyltransferase RsmG [Clostridiales bacterium]